MPRRVPSARPPAASSGPAGLHPWRSDPRPSLCLRTSGPVPECRALTGSQVGGGACRAPGRRVLTEGMPGEAGLLLPAPRIPTRTPSPPSAAGSLWPVMFPTSLAFSSVQRSAPSEGAGDTGLIVTVTARLATSSKPAWSPTFSELRQRRSTGWEEGPCPGHTGPRSAALGLRPPPLPPAVGRPTPVLPPCWCWGRMGSRRKGIPGGGSVGEGVHLHLHGSGPGHHPCSPVSSSWPCPSSLPIGWPRKHRRIEMGPRLSWLPSTLPLPISHHYPPLAWRLEGLTPGAHWNASLAF